MGRLSKPKRQRRAAAKLGRQSKSQQHQFNSDLPNPQQESPKPQPELSNPQLERTQVFVAQSLEIRDKNEDLEVVYFSPEDDGDSHFLDQPSQSTDLKSDGFSTNDKISDFDITAAE